MARALISVLIVSTPLIWSVAAQETPRPAYRVGAELVVVDLVATDRSGKAVVDLQPADIQLLENGKPQKIQFVTLVRGGRTSARDAASSAGAAEAPPDSPTAALPAREPGALVAIVLDLVSMPAETTPRVREAIERMVRDELPPDAAVMIATIDYGVSIKQALTTDRETLLRAVAALPVRPPAQLNLTEVLEKADDACGSNPAGGSVEPAQSAISQGVTLGKALIAETRQRLASTSEALSALARSLGAMPGRKHVVFYSAGYPLNPVDDVIEAVTAGAAACLGVDPQQSVPGAGRTATNLRQQIAQEFASMKSVDSTILVQSAIDRANRAQVSFYAVDPRGLVTTNVQAQHRGNARLARAGVLQKAATLDQTASQAYLQTIAGGTSGIAFLNSNDLTRGLRRAWLDANEYYLIGYAPSGSRKKGQFQKIELKIARPDLDVRYRRGYYEATDHEIAQKDVESALRNPSSFTQDGFDVETQMEGGKLWVVTFIPPSAIRFAADGELQKAAFSVHATLRDPAGKLVGGKPVIGRDLGVSLKADRLKELLGSGSRVEIRTDVDPPSPGTYQLAVVVRDSGGWIAARAVELTVPPR